ncbi:phosphate-starvation-inducible PsiE family protein [Palleronia sediminis]|nr:phosphate-starvation-inducible PsiE family protein [Palleronia sediminis]
MEHISTDSPSRTLRIYAHVSRAVSAVILVGMVAVVLLAVWSFLVTLVEITVATDATLDYPQFQILFDRVLAAVIALELAHSIGQMVAGDHGLAQVRTVVTIGMLAVVRKLIVIEMDQATGFFLLGIGGAVVALAGALVAIHWIARHERKPG